MPSRCRRAILATPILAAAALLVRPGAALAGDEEAKEWHSQGLELFEAQQYSRAAEAFRRAWALKPSWKLLYNIGQAEAAASQYGLALDAFEAYLVEGADDVPAERHEEVLAEIQRLRVLVGVVELSAPGGAELVVDGFSRGRIPFDGPIRVAAGKHRIQVILAGETLLDRRVSIAGGMTTTLEVGSGEPQAPPDEEESEPGREVAADDGGEPAGEESSGLLVGGLVSLGLGAAGVAVGAVYAYRFGEDYEEYESLARSADRARFDELENEVLPLDQTLEIVGLALGGALVVTGAALLIADAAGGEDVDREDVSVAPRPLGLAISF